MKYPDDYVDKTTCGDCIKVMAGMPENSVDAIVTDPPYGLGFMGKDWDKVLPPKEWLEQAMRIMKPGASIMVMGGTRTFHRMAVMIEDAGFIIKDTLCWLYGSGFPKAQDLGKMIDKREGAERAVIGKYQHPDGSGKRKAVGMPIVNTASPRKKGGEWNYSLTAPTSDLAKHWDGFKIGGIKPAWEPIIWAVKPPEGAWIDNMLKWGVGAVNVDECRIDSNGYTQGGKNRSIAFGMQGLSEKQPRCDGSKGRFPANVIHDGSDEVVGLFPDTKSGSGIKKQASGSARSIFDINKIGGKWIDGDSGSAARFFYCAKSSRSERNAGCEGMETIQARTMSDGNGIGGTGPHDVRPKENFHPTVKPIALMEYLIKLVTRSGQVVLDPFCGSGSTICAASGCNRHSIGIDISPDYCKIAKGRSRKRQGVLMEATA